MTVRAVILLVLIHAALFLSQGRDPFVSTVTGQEQKTDGVDEPRSSEFQRIFRILSTGRTSQRAALATEIQSVPGELRTPLLTRLLNDSDQAVLLAALEAIRDLPHEKELSKRVEELARSSRHLPVRERAKLTLLEWTETVQHPPGKALRHTERPTGDPLQTHVKQAEWSDPLPRAKSSAAFKSGGSTVQQVEATRNIPPDRDDPPIIHPSSIFEDFEQAVAGYRSARSSAVRPRTPSELKAKPVLDDPGVLRDPDERFPDPPVPNGGPDDILTQPTEDLLPLGFTGPSGVIPSERQSSLHAVPIHDRWRLGFPDWNRLENPEDPQDNYPYTKGHWWDPYNQNVLKGDYPIIGQHTFLNITASSQMIHEYRQVPTGTSAFESTVNPFQEEFFGNPDQYFYTHFLTLSVEMFHGSTAFKPFDWRVRIAPVLNFNYLDTNELGIVNPDVREGTTRFRDYLALEEWFVEAKLADLGPDYDFLSTRLGSQLIVTDFRGFVLSDINRGVRLFGTRHQNRDQFNIWWLDQVEKDTNSQLNTFDDRHQNTVVMNYFRQDTFVPGYTLQASFHYNRDQSSVEFDDNDFLVRPDPAGIYQPHEVESYYYGLAGDGHFGILNVSHAFYHVEGTDSNSPLGGEPADINANMFAIELSVDRDWIRFRTSYFWASGDDDPNDGKAEGFDTIFDNPNFAGGEFSYWNRQEIRLFGVGLSQRLSLVPNLRSSKTQGQSNFVNPGIQIVNLGMDFEITPKTKAITNLNWLWFDETAVLDQFTFQDNIDRKIGIDLSLGLEYRPLLNDNIQIIAGASMLVPDRGFKDLYGVTDPFTRSNANSTDVDNLYAGFLDLILIY